VGEVIPRIKVYENKPRLNLTPTYATEVTGTKTTYDSGIKYDSGYYYDRWYNNGEEITQGESASLKVEQQNAIINIKENIPKIKIL
jgi:uncharacterized protein YegP (UPF0339 family)